VSQRSYPEAVTDQDIVIERGLPDELRAQAAEIFEEAFGPKMRMAVGDPDKRMAFVARASVADHAIIARRGDEILGMAGLSSKGGAYAGGLLGQSWDPRPYRHLLGWPGATRAVWAMRMGAHRPNGDELYIDGIAVSTEARGRGLGTRLLDEAVIVAQEQGKRYVRLDVIDTNPRAQALYERLGYQVTRVQSFRIMERWLGFGGMVSMELLVGGDNATDV
jgi:ribosomal protein S18 acetylase RimI-like enzyme